MEEKNYPGSSYQNLFNYLTTEHGLILLESEMNDLINLVHKFHPQQPADDNARYELSLALRDLIKLAKLPGRSIAEYRERIEAAETMLKKHSKVTDILRIELPAPAREEDAVEKLKSSLDYYRGMIAGLGDSETDDFNRSVYFQHSGDLYTAIKIIEKYEKYFNELFNQQKHP